ncbi:MAG: glutamate racemase [Bermanella sp.]
MPRILLFDSGIGGISILNEVKAVLPQAEYHYFADHAAAPYGEKNDDWLNSQVTYQLINLDNNISPDLIIVACNTASTLSLKTLRNNIKTPIIGVVPAIKTALQQSNSNCIGLLATPATIARPYIDNLILQYTQNNSVIRIGSTQLVLFAEEKLNGGFIKEEIIKDIIQPFILAECKHVVLGCTHFPLLREELEMLAPEISWIDSGKAIATRVQKLLNTSLIDKSADNYFYSSGFIGNHLKQHLTKVGFSHIIESHNHTCT